MEQQGNSDLESRFGQNISENFSFLKNAEIFLAISGGRDSVVLLHLLLAAGFRPVLLHCNFGLRGEESDGDEAFVAGLRDTVQIEFFSRRFDMKTEMARTGKGVQETARMLRYDWFSTFTDIPGKFLITAHHFDDSVETFFINLSRGTGLKGMAGIPERRGAIIRPLLNVTSQEIEHYAKSKNISYRLDSSNLSDEYFRNRIRHQLIPQLEEFWPDFRLRLSELFGEVKNYSSLIQDFSRSFRNRFFRMDSEFVVVPICELVNLQPDFLIIELFGEFGIRRNNVDLLKELFHAQTGKKLETANCRFTREREQLIIGGRLETDPVSHHIESIPESMDILGHRISFVPLAKTEKLKFDATEDDRLQRLDLKKIKFPLLLRTWQKGDKMRPLGLLGSKLISDILTDKRVNTIVRKQALVITDQSGAILAILGLVISEEFKVSAGSMDILEIRIAS